ncbi:MAG TPA: NAD-binding protein [Jatrophihabitans sp.]|jgi:voltage-gated potassium channel|uniref:potassium channel family protein n=1 Tax=Jatrophihabitans sp. TaxID=1932789 RepID=UPI002DFEB393|nr:NAD-binding protein [Jatrophihabitans sp.]
MTFWARPGGGGSSRRRRDGSEIVRRLQVAVALLFAVIVGGSVGYVILGFGVLDAVYQTVTTVTTVGFREVQPLSSVGKVFTIVLVLAGVGTALYTFGVALEAIVEGHLMHHLEARRMDRAISRMRAHVIICGWGRVGRACAGHLAGAGQGVVVVDRDPVRLADIGLPSVLGDISDDEVLRKAGVMNARALVAALDTDADNVYVVLSARALRPDLVIIARARSEESTAKLLRAGADRVVNPQLIGGRRMAAFAMQPHVAEFLDVVMHDETVDYDIEQVEIAAASTLCGRTVGEAAIAARTGAAILALRAGSRADFLPDPRPDVRLDERTILIAVGTPAQLESLRALAQG